MSAASNRCTVDDIDVLVESEVVEKVLFDAACENLEQMLWQLPAIDREILQLRFYQDLHLDEIATQLEIGLSATKRLRQVYNNQVYDNM